MLDRKGVDFTADLYGIGIKTCIIFLGAILYELLVGIPAHYDENINKMYKNISKG